MVKRTRQVKRVVGMAGGGRATQKAISKTIKAGNKDKARRAAAGAIKQASRTKQGKQLKQAAISKVQKKVFG